MFSGKLLSTIAGIIALGAIALLFGGISTTYGSSKPATAGVNETGTIVLFGASGAEWKPSQNEIPEGSQDEMKLAPKDGKIDGKTISALTPTGVNSVGQVVGHCILENKDYAFVREPDGRFWLFKPPSDSGEGEFTDISDSGKAVGVYERDLSKSKVGFLMDSQGQWVMDIQYPANPCRGARSHLHTEPNGINSHDEIVGNFDCTAGPDDPSDPLFRGNGFYRASDGTFYRVQYENAIRTVAGKISDSGVIFGYYVEKADEWVPFAAEKKDVIRPIVP